MHRRASGWLRRGAGRSATETTTTAVNTAADLIYAAVAERPPRLTAAASACIQIERQSGAAAPAANSFDAQGRRMLPRPSWRLVSSWLRASKAIALTDWVCGSFQMENRPAAASTQGSHSEHKSKVVPTAAVRERIDSHIRKNLGDQRERRDKSMH